MDVRRPGFVLILLEQFSRIEFWDAVVTLVAPRPVWSGNKES